MDDGFVGIFLVFSMLFGGFGGYMIGDYNSRQAITECQKELPRNVNCKIIAVPVDKN